MPDVVDDTHYNDHNIYFESEEDKQAYLVIAVECRARDFRVNVDNPTEVFIDEGWRYLSPSCNTLLSVMLG